MIATGKKLAMVSLLSVGLLLGGCDMSTPTKVRTSKIQVSEQMKTETLNANALDEARVAVIAKDYLRNGRSKSLGLMLTYDVSSEAAFMRAQHQRSLFMRAFERNGVHNLDVDLLPVNDPAKAGRAIASYRAMSAAPPDGCTRMPGWDGVGHRDTLEDYEFGCEVDSVISKMVSDPEDMLGKAGTQDGDARRQGGVVERYRSGEPNESLEGLSSSGGVGE